MAELMPGLLIMLVLVLIGLSVVLGVFCGLSILATVIGREILGRGSPRLVAFLGSGCLPMLILLLFLIAISAALEPDFRGPEIIGIAIVFIIMAFSMLIGWPVSYFVTRRVLGDR